MADIPTANYECVSKSPSHIDEETLGKSLSSTDENNEQKMKEDTEIDAIKSTEETSIERESRDECKPHNDDDISFKTPSLPLLKAQTPSSDVGEITKHKPTPIAFKAATTSIGASLSNVSEPVPYTEPPWACIPEPDSGYNLDMLKNDVMLVNQKLNVDKSFFVIGRLAQCDLLLEHPSISRFHAVLQYGNDGMEKTVRRNGWYLYDLGSTHGSWRNKQQVHPRQYIRLHVGHMIKFGGSTRIFILQGPEEDEEEESSKTVTEIRKEGERRKLIIEGVIEADPEKDADFIKQTETNKPEADNQRGGISWGMDDDYEVDDDDDKGEGEIMDFESFEQREQYYRNDPKKVLKNFFDRESYELTYEYEEKGSSFRHQWVCKIELPIESITGKSVFAEVSVSGNKREAQVKCALEACRILDANGVLRKSQSESKRKKLKDLADNDYYDSDEDIYLDRTGELEDKRNKRKRRMEETSEPSKMNTYSSLCERLENVKKEMNVIQNQLDKLSSTQTVAKQRTGQDPLDVFMTSVRNPEDVVDETQEVKIQKSQLRLKLVQMKRDADRLEKLVKVAKPIKLPALKKSTHVLSISDNKQQSDTTEKKPKLVWIGSIKGHRLRKVAQVEQTVVPEPVQTGYKEDEVEEEEEEEVESSEPPKEDTITSDDIKKDQSQLVQTPSNSSIEETVSTDDNTKHNKSKVYTVEMPPEPVEEEEEAQSDDIALSDTKGRSRIRIGRKSEKKKDDLSKVYDSSNPDFAVWLPPDTQTGDGKTSLNEKFGY